jgi:AAA domain
MQKKKLPHEVFTPKSFEVNNSMYVRRAELETRLIDAFPSNRFIVIHGESGNGKTWLFKKVFADNNVHFDVVNLGNASGAVSLDRAFEVKLGEWGSKQKASEGTASSAGAKPMGMGVEHRLDTTTSYAKKPPFHHLVEEVRRRANSDSRCAIVFDNFEAIVDEPKLVRELVGIILSADDETFAKHNIQLVIVGTPTNLKQTIVQLSKSAPVANRLVEIPEVARMSVEEAAQLVEQGFVQELGLEFDNSVSKDQIYSEISWNTDRIAQHIQELCLLIAQEATRNSGIIGSEVLAKATDRWTKDTLSADIATINGSMNARDTRIGRKNQTLYCLGQCKLEDFKYTDIENLLRINFNVGGAALNISQILSGFAAEENPIITRNPKADAWRFVSPKYRMAIRALLKKEADGRISLRQPI